MGLVGLAAAIYAAATFWVVKRISLTGATDGIARRERVEDEFGIGCVPVCPLGSCVAVRTWHSLTAYTLTHGGYGS